MKVAVIGDFHPGDVVTHGPYAVALIFECGHHHGEVGLAASAGKRRAHVSHFSAGRFEPKNEHVLGHPALFARHHAGDAQRKTLFAEQGVAAVAGADAPNQFFFGEMQDVAAHGIEIAERVQARNKFAGCPKAVHGDLAHARHDAHARDDIRTISGFHADFADW